ncbi:MAG: glutamate racemase [Oscillospiraceae bacterium]|nr:glutamate racemase [Oscillospiraceae bacterium]
MGFDTRPIGVFDSGLGGLTGFSRLRALLPGEDLVYFGDTARVPYGTRGRDIITKYARQDANFLMRFGIKLLFIACNTASYAALDTLARELPIPVCGVIEDASRAAALKTKNGRIGVLGTAATISGHVYSDCLHGLDPSLSVCEQACRLFVPVVEAGRFSPDDPVVQILTREYLEPVLSFGADTIILGCTHYPLLAPAIAQAAPDAVLIDSGAEAAQRVASLLAEKGLQNAPDHKGTVRYYVSDTTAGFAQAAEMFLQHKLEGEVGWVDIEKY